MLIWVFSIKINLLFYRSSGNDSEDWLLESLESWITCPVLLLKWRMCQSAKMQLFVVQNYYIYENHHISRIFWCQKITFHPLVIHSGQHFRSPDQNLIYWTKFWILAHCAILLSFNNLLLIWISCVSFRAPSDCVQYFTGISGEVKSFNFDGGIQLRDIQYTICIRRETGSCGIQYTVQDNTTPDSYDLSDASANANVG